MDSDTFMEKFDSGELGDDDDFFDRYAAKNGLDIIWIRLRYELFQTYYFHRNFRQLQNWISICD